MDERYTREKLFHDESFGRGRRASAGPFYRIIDGRRAYYQAILRSRCPGRRVLDYGCGTGDTSLFLAKCGGKVSGIDISEVAIGRARKRLEAMDVPGVELRVMNAEALDFPSSTFDVVCGTGILHHLDLKKAFREIHRVLRNGGCAVFAEPMGHNPMINLYRRITPSMRTKDEHPLTVSDIALAESFFQNVRPKYFHLVSLAAIPLWWFPGFGRLVRLLDNTDSVLFRLLPPLTAYAWAVVVVMEKK